MKMTKAKVESNGKIYKLRYSEHDSFDHLPYEQCKQVYGVCFYNNKMVVVYSTNNGEGNVWILPGGTKEEDETYEQTLIREVQEETNMQVLSYLPIGVQKVINPDKSIDYQLRYAALVEPIGEFESDPDGDIQQIKLINPAEYKNYFDWGEIGDRIVARALKLRESLKV
jgi:ADP-ribose pyrophosphatase YjhB (NUDIX family)